MIDEYEFYHGAVLWSLITESREKISICADDSTGRIDSFCINGEIAIHIKHSIKRLSPWQFTFTRDNVEELIELDKKYKSLFICLVCGDDGIVALTPDEFLEVAGPAKSEVFWIRVSRPKNKMYEVSGTAGILGSKKSRGLGLVADAVRSSSGHKSV
jgi:hypothetical protein